MVNSVYCILGEKLVLHFTATTRPTITTVIIISLLLLFTVTHFISK
jgi:hypothetical protein